MGDLTKKEIIDYLNGDGKALFELANEVKKQNVGDVVQKRALIEFSNYCKQNCLYCGIRKDNKLCQRYRLNPDEIIEHSVKAVKLGYDTVVLQSGEDEFYTTEKMQYIISEIKKLGLILTLSVGEKTFEQYEAYKNAGVDKFLLKIETTDSDLYGRLHPNMSIENRIEAHRNLKKLGFELGSGCLVGLPNQTIESLADDILFFKSIEADMVGIGAFVPSPDTPLKGEAPANIDLALKVMAITRIILPKANIPATTAMETIKENGRKLALQSGANVIMDNITEPEYRRLYKIYPKK